MLLFFSYFTTSPDGRPGAGGNEIKANSAQLSWAGTWAELGHIATQNVFVDVETSMFKKDHGLWNEAQW